MENQTDKPPYVDSSVLTHGDILLYALNYLGAHDIANSRLVCKYWKKVSDDERLWKGSRGTYKARLQEQFERKRKRAKEKKQSVEDVNRDIVHLLSIHTPIHDIIYIILLVLSMILSSLRVDNIISVRYVFLFIPGLIALTGWMIKGLNIVIFFSKYERASFLQDLTSTFTHRGFLSSVGKRWHHINLTIFFFLALLTAILFIVQDEIEEAPSWIVIIPMVFLFLHVVFISLTNCSGSYILFTEKAKAISDDMHAAAKAAFFSAISVSIYMIFVVLKVAGVIHWHWALVHIPMWIQYFFGYVIPLIVYIRINLKQTWRGSTCEKLRSAFGLVSSFWAIFAAPWFIFHVLLVLKLEQIATIKCWGLLIPLELQLVGLLIIVGFMTKTFLQRPLGRLWYMKIASPYTLLRYAKSDVPIDGDEESHVYCWKATLASRWTT